MQDNIFWGFAFIAAGTIVILNKLYAVSVPFEVMVGLFLIMVGLSKLFQQQKHRHTS
jgi:hypothetical protein